MHLRAGSPSTPVTGPEVPAAARAAPCQERLRPRVLRQGSGLWPVLPRARRSQGGEGPATCRRRVGRQGWYGLLMRRLQHILRGVDLHEVLGWLHVGCLSAHRPHVGRKHGTNWGPGCGVWCGEVSCSVVWCCALHCAVLYCPMSLQVPECTTASVTKKFNRNNRTSCAVGVAVLWPDECPHSGAWATQLSQPTAVENGRRKAKAPPDATVLHPRGTPAVAAAAARAQNRPWRPRPRNRRRSGRPRRRAARP